MRLIGDVHGKWGPYKRIIRAGSPPSIQVGDMGVGFVRWPHGELESGPPHALMVKGNHRFIRGNHDGPAAARRHSQYIPDGHVEGDVMFIGGAASIDAAWRIEGYSWWADEELSMAELQTMIDKYLQVKPRVLITHDCPEEFATVMQHASGRSKLDLRSRTRDAFQHMWSGHSPELWVFGHWHHNFECVAQGTRFVCLAELAHRDDLL